MINKESDKEPVQHVAEKDQGFIDSAKMDVQCHIVIRDADTKEILVNKRG